MGGQLVQHLRNAGFSMRVKKVFAGSASSEPDLCNLQRGCFDRAIATLDEICDEHSNWSDSQYLRKACFIIVDLGISVTQLIGQQFDSETGRVPSPKVGFRELLKQADEKGIRYDADLYNRFVDLIDLYDDIRHFGPPKYDGVENIDTETVENCVAIAQDVWKLILQLCDYHGELPDFLEPIIS